MGSEEGDEDEAPVHAVTVGPFELMRSEVTVAHYTDCVDAEQCEAPADDLGSDQWGYDHPDMPVTYVSLMDARAFCRWLDHARLPSEAEWEYAARSEGQDRRFPWGDEEPAHSHAVFDRSDGLLSPVQPWSVCDHPDGDSDQGVCDLAGSAWELVEDCYHGGYEVPDEDGVLVTAPDDGDPWLEACEDAGVARGGSYASSTFDPLRVSSRAAAESETSGYSDVGFRCAR